MRKTGFILSVALMVIMVSCKDVVPKPAPTPLGPAPLRFVLNALPGSVPAGTSLFAIVSVEDKNNAEVISNRTIPLVASGDKYTSETIELELGAYKLTKFIVVNADGLARYATPRINSEKSSLVQKPLYSQLELKTDALKEIPMEVVAIADQDKAELFGYPAGSFRLLSAETYLSIKLQAVVSIGDIVYDSIPANFKITSWDAAGQKFEKDTLLSAGAKEVFLNAAHTRFSFKVDKWGISDEMTLNRNEVTEGTTYVLGGAKEPKKLKLEETSVLVNGVYKPDSKVIYSYGANGDLSKVEYYQKLPQFTELQLVNQDLYQYNGEQLTKIERFEGDGDKVGFTEFTYNAQGTKITNIVQKNYDQQTGAAIAYNFPPGQALIFIDYLYNNGNSMQYKMKFVGGNNVEDIATSSRGGGESGKYKYDFNINPYAHMNMPNIFLSNLSRNNLVEQAKTYTGSFPTMEPAGYEYTYDNEGYPTQLVKSFRNYQGQQVVYKAKTVYTY